MHSNHFCLHCSIAIFVRAACEDVHLKKVIINFLNLATKDFFNISFSHNVYKFIRLPFHWLFI